MHASKSSALEEILSKNDESDAYVPEGRPGRKPGSGQKPVQKPAGRNNQAWRAIEDMKNRRQLDKGLKEIYEDD